MANSWKSSLIVPVETAVEASPADVFTWIVEHPLRVTDVSVVISTLTAIDMTSAVASVDAVIDGAARAEQTTLTITDAVAVGTELSAAETDTSWEPFELDEGDTLYFEHKTAGVDAGTEAGEYYFILYYEIIPDGVV